MVRGAGGRPATISPQGLQGGRLRLEQDTVVQQQDTVSRTLFQLCAALGALEPTARGFHAIFLPHSCTRRHCSRMHLCYHQYWLSQAQVLGCQGGTTPGVFTLLSLFCVRGY